MLYLISFSADHPEGLLAGVAETAADANAAILPGDPCSYRILTEEEFQTWREHGNLDWVAFTRRTNDPKLAYIEGRLAEQSIPYRRHGASAHAPILQVPSVFLEEAWAMLSAPFAEGRETLDDMEDDDPVFQDGHLGALLAPLDHPPARPFEGRARVLDLRPDQEMLSIIVREPDGTQSLLARIRHEVSRAPISARDEAVAAFIAQSWNAARPAEAGGVDDL